MALLASAAPTKTRKALHDMVLTDPEVQVFDLQEYRPGPVLKKIWDNLKEREALGDQIAPIIARWTLASAQGHYRWRCCQHV